MRAALFAFSRQGVQTARRVIEALSPDWACRLFAPEKYADAGAEALTEDVSCATGRYWNSKDAIVYVAACGIAVRALAPWAADKATDPAVICVDNCGKFTIPLLSGHIGGGNRLARRIAQGIGAVCVVTTATDLNGRFAADEWARQYGFVISSLGTAKRVSAAILENDLPLASDAQVKGALPPGIFRGETGELGIHISYRITSPFKDTLQLIPRVLTLGIGCRRGSTAQQIGSALNRLLEKEKIDPRAIKACASIDLKKDETGLIAFCQEKNWPLAFYSGRELAALSGQFSSSDFVKGVTGVDNVCERSAAMDGGRIIVSKTAWGGVTLALAEQAWEVCFD